MTNIYRYTILLLALALVGVSGAYYVEHKRAVMGDFYRQALLDTRDKLVKVDSQRWYFHAKWDALQLDVARAKRSGRLKPGPVKKVSVNKKPAAPAVVKPTRKKI